MLVLCKFTVLVGLLVQMVGCNREALKIADQPPLVRAIQVSQFKEDALDLRGSVGPRDRLRLGFKTPGILRSVKVREGDRVQAGQLLAVLDDLDARSQSAVAQASLDRARREAERTDRLVKEGALPANQRENTKNELESAEALWKQTEDGVRHTRILAPFSGTVYQRLAEPGEALGAGVTVLVLDSTDCSVVRTGVAERELSYLKVGMGAQLLNPGALPCKAKITSVSSAPGADGLYAVELVHEGGSLRSGSLVQIKIPVDSELGRIRIPFSALVSRQGNNYVAVLHREVGVFKVHFRAVKVEKADGAGVILGDGLVAGEHLVSEGGFFLQDGQTVRILE